MKETLNVGVARRCITPPLGTILYGYPLAREAQAVGDDLHVVAAAFACGDVRALLISADICSCSGDFVAVIRNAITEKTGIPTRRVLSAMTLLQVRQLAGQIPGRGFTAQVILKE